jgi:indolepyruvate ferredoxin oxidoreductase, beta subunit
MTMLDEVNILVAGVGGQGNILASAIISKAAIDAGYRVIASETFGASQRGGAVASHVRISNRSLSPIIPEGKGDILLGFEPLESLRIGSKFLSSKAWAIINTRPIYPVDVMINNSRYPSVDEILTMIRKISGKTMAIEATKLAEKAGDPLAMNLVMVGALAGTGKLPIELSAFKETITEIVPKRTVEVNIKAFEAGYNDIKEKMGK